MSFLYRSSCGLFSSFHVFPSVIIKCWSICMAPRQRVHSSRSCCSLPFRVSVTQGEPVARRRLGSIRLTCSPRRMRHQGLTAPLLVPLFRFPTSGRGSQIISIIHPVCVWGLDLLMVRGAKGKTTCGGCSLVIIQVPATRE